MKLRWSVALLVVLAAAVGYAQMPTTTTVERPGLSAREESESKCWLSLIAAA